MRYAKLIDDEIIYAKNPLKIDEQHIITNDFGQYGFKPVVIPEAPTQEGYYAVPDGFEETEGEIIQKWRLEAIQTRELENETEVMI